MENASRRYSYEKVRDIIQRQKEKYGWEFLFLGANIDAVREAARFGINLSGKLPGLALTRTVPPITTQTPWVRK